MYNCKLQQYRGTQDPAAYAAGLGITEETYLAYESGSRIPRDEVKKQIADRLDASVKEIFYAE